jgi:hypothetical protein
MIRENSPLAVFGRRKRSVDYRTHDKEAQISLLPSAWPTVDEVFHVTAIAWGVYADRRARLSTVLRGPLTFSEIHATGGDD